MVLGRILEELLGDDAQHETKDRPAVSTITDGKNCVVEVRAASELRDAVRIQTEENAVGFDSE